MVQTYGWTHGELCEWESMGDYVKKSDYDKDMVQARNALNSKSRELEKAEEYIKELIELNPGLDTPESESKYKP